MLRVGVGKLAFNYKVTTIVPNPFPLFRKRKIFSNLTYLETFGHDYLLLFILFSGFGRWLGLKSVSSCPTDYHIIYHPLPV